MGGNLKTGNSFPAAAYSYFALGMDIARQRGLKQAIPMLCLNLGNLYADPSQTVISDEARQRAKRLCREGFEMAVAEGQQELAVKCFINMMWDEDIFRHPEKASADIARFEKLKITENLADLPFARTVASALTAMARQRTQDAMQVLRNFKIQPSVNDPLIEARMQVSVPVLMSWVHSNAEHIDSATYYAVQALRKAEAGGFPDERVSMLRRLEELHKTAGRRDSAAFYRNAYLELNDSLMHSENFGTVMELQYMHDLDREQRAALESAARSRLQSTWLILCAVLLLLGVLFIIFVTRKNRRLRAANEVLYRQTRQLLSQDDTPVNANPDAAATDTGQQPAVKPVVGDDVRSSLLPKIEEALANPDVLFDPDLTVSTLAKHLGSNPRYVSQLINERWGATFPNVLGQLRIKQFLLRLDQDPGIVDRYTLGTLATRCGFKNHGTFIAAFRRTTGLTPSDYLRHWRQDRP